MYDLIIIGSGPAGLAAAQQLNRKGHYVTVFEKENGLGGLLRYGIPNFKLNKNIIDRRMAQLIEEGIEFKTNTEVGKDISGKEIMSNYDAVCIAIGAGHPRDIKPEGRNLKGIHFAMEFLIQQNKRLGGEPVDPAEEIHAGGKNVVIIGGGDTGADCLGTSLRQGARQVVQMEILPEPPVKRAASTPWPMWPLQLRVSSSHKEGGLRRWSVATRELVGEQGVVKALRAVEVEWVTPDQGGRPVMREKPGTEFIVEADLVLLAMGFLHLEHGPLVKDLDLKLDPRGNLVVDADHMTSHPGVFAAGDAETGASLVVRAIDRGRRAAERIDAFLGKR